MYIPGAGVDANLIIRQVPTIATIPIVATSTPQAAPTIINPVATPTSAGNPTAAPVAQQQNCPSNSGSLAGAIVGSIIGTLLICYAIYAIRNRNTKATAAAAAPRRGSYNGDYDRGYGGGPGVGHGAGGFEGRRSGHAGEVGRDGKKRYSGIDTKIEAAPHSRHGRSRSRRDSRRNSYVSYEGGTARPERVVYRD